MLQAYVARAGALLRFSSLFTARYDFDADAPLLSRCCRYAPLMLRHASAIFDYFITRYGATFADSRHAA